jgi:hypothetical protein
LQYANLSAHPKNTFSKVPWVSGGWANLMQRPVHVTVFNSRFYRLLHQDSSNTCSGKNMISMRSASMMNKSHFERKPRSGTRLQQDLPSTPRDFSVAWVAVIRFVDVRRWSGGRLLSDPFHTRRGWWRCLISWWNRGVIANLSQHVPWVQRKSDSENLLIETKLKAPFKRFSLYTFFYTLYCATPCKQTATLYSNIGRQPPWAFHSQTTLQLVGNEQSRVKETG